MFVSVDFDDGDDYYADDLIDEPSVGIVKKIPLKIKLASLALVSILGYSMLGSTFASNLQLGTGRVEYGQGFTQTLACDTNVIITPYASFANASGAAAAYKLTAVKVTGLDSGCYGKDIILKFYDSTTATPLTLYQTGSSTNYDQIRVYDNSGSFNLQNAGLISSDIADVTGGFQVNFFNSATPASVAQTLATSVYKITIESVNHDATLSLVSLPSGSMNFTTAGSGLGYASNAVFNFGTGNFTVDAWAKIPSGLSNGTFFTAGGNVNATGGFAFWIEGGIIRIRRNGVGADISVSIDASWRNTWHHYAAVRGNTRYGIYVDGKLVVDAADTGESVTTTDPTVAQLAGFENQYTFQGEIRNLRVVKGTALYYGANVGTTYFTPQAAPLGKVAGTVLLLLAQDSGNPSYDSSDYHWTSNRFTAPVYVAP